MDTVSPVAVLIIRAWCEADGGFRARILDLRDPAAGEQTVAVVSRPEDIVAVVERWVEAAIPHRPFP